MSQFATDVNGRERTVKPSELSSRTKMSLLGVLRDLVNIWGTRFLISRIPRAF
jgi:hypothetical protein